MIDDPGRLASSDMVKVNGGYQITKPNVIDERHGRRAPACKVRRSGTRLILHLEKAPSCQRRSHFFCQTNVGDGVYAPNGPLVRAVVKTFPRPRRSPAFPTAEPPAADAWHRPSLRAASSPVADLICDQCCSLKLAQRAALARAAGLAQWVNHQPASLRTRGTASVAYCTTEQDGAWVHAPAGLRRRDAFSTGANG